MSKKRKKNPATIGLSSPDVEGQGTTSAETGNYQKSSARKKNKQS
ncbi:MULTISPECIES: YuzL family protein [Bacillaceae]|nr:YuzL family protein [Cytobacillus sp. IB215316]MDX8362959.1 YuzL family protein [Cytobacillus sp. IB215316]